MPQWARIEPLLPDRTPKRGGRWRDHRQVIDAIAFKFQTGTQWVHLPEKYGNWRGVRPSGWSCRTARSCAAGCHASAVARASGAGPGPVGLEGAPDASARWARVAWTPVPGGLRLPYGGRSRERRHGRQPGNH
ncbi:transposase [Streptomyces sp. NPDC004393]